MSSPFPFFGRVLRFFQLLGYRDYLSSFSLLKSKDKLQKQDQVTDLSHTLVCFDVDSVWHFVQIFKLICNDLDWEFLPST